MIAQKILDRERTKSYMDFWNCTGFKLNVDSRKTHIDMSGEYGALRLTESKS